MLFTACSSYAQENSKSVKDTGCIAGDCQNAYGRYVYADGQYEGFFKNGKRNGFGTFLYDNYDLYSGVWKENVFYGYGIFKIFDDRTLAGNFSAGKLEGYGTEINGAKEGKNGIFKAGKLIKEYLFKSNKNEEGCTKGDCTNGYGKFIFKNGEYVIGFFEKGDLKQGSWFGTNGEKYNGEFAGKNAFNGFGLMSYANGDSHVGFWKNNTADGEGVTISIQNDSTIPGIWTNEELTTDYKFEKQ